VLVEPASVIMRGLRIADSLTMPKILVIGAGTIGLLTVAGLRLLGFGGEIHVAAKYPLGATLARELGADRVYPSAWEAARAIGSRSWRALLGPPAWRGGFPLVIDAAGSQTSLDQAAWTVREGGRILLLGAPGVVRHDFSPYWFRSIEFRGTYTYAEADFRRAVELLPKAAGIERLITNVFPLSDWQKALETAVHHRGIKVVFTP
jgi:threonine dehydrogenase-like Zn-dependent dehydrogenase